MTVYANKPAFNVREKLKELEKPSGIAGRAMLAADTVAEQQALIGVGRRNLVMNGGFDVWQRGTTVTTASNSYQNFTSDRWSAYFAGTYSKQTTTLPNGDYVNYFRGVLGTTGDNRININHFIENGNSILSGKYITVSFWLKASVIDSQVNVKIQTTSGSTFSSYTVIANKYIETSLDWKKYEITLKCNNDIANIGARAHGLLEIDGVDGSWANGTTFEIAQVQMELGKVATPFEHRSYGEELALCQRYFEKLATNGENDANRYNGIAWATNNLNVFIPFLVAKRSAPTVSITNNGEVFTGGWQSADGSTVIGTGLRGCTISIQKASAYTVKYGYFIRNQTITASAEL
jgi:hypothetical protein